MQIIRNDFKEKNLTMDDDEFLFLRIYWDNINNN